MTLNPRAKSTLRNMESVKLTTSIRNPGFAVTKTVLHDRNKSDFRSLTNPLSPRDVVN